MKFSQFSSFYFSLFVGILVSIVSFSCVSVEEYNKRLAQPISEKDLIKDVNFVQ